MDTHTRDNDPLAAAYAESVDHEREAWHVLQSHRPGTDERIRAWKAWSEAISRTNDAWRRLNARRFAETAYAVHHAGAGSHAGA
jgi:hypothetical protein